MQDRVSVILAVYNTPVKLLDRAIKSVLSQTYENVELVIIDDCSPNFDVKEYLNSVKSTDTCKVIIHQKDRNMGVSDSLNIGVRLSTGYFCCLLDHDDYLESDYIEKMYKRAVETCADIVVGGMKHIDKNGEIISTFPPNALRYKECAFPWSSDTNMSRLFKRSLIIDNDITYPVGAWTEDVIFTAKIYPHAKKVAVLPYEGYANYINPDSSSRSISFYSLRTDQIPFRDIEAIVESNLTDRYPYISGLMNNEMMLISTMLTLFSEKKVKKDVYKKFGDLSRRLKCTGKELYIYNSIIHGHGFIKLLDWMFIVFNKMHIEWLYYFITRVVLKPYYRKKYGAN